ncbi:MAG: NifB/NifX family molybdenum-iron cluster-binding protein [Promethearchaeota archaeon]
MIRVVVASQAPGGLDAYIDPRFARCAFYTVVDVDNSRIELANVVQNTSVDAFRGAGIQAAQTVANLGANAIIAGNLGPNALASLNQVGIKVFAGPLGTTVRDAVQEYIKGELTEITSPTAPGIGGGRGMGRGMGRGGGGGRRR